MECTVAESSVNGSHSGNCDIDVDECVSAPCRNGAMCTESSVEAGISLHTYRCRCSPGFARGQCDYDFIALYTAECSVFENTASEGVVVSPICVIGPNVTFTNDKYPRAKASFEVQQILIKKNASVGAGSIILGGITIGENSMIGAGSLVTKSVSPNELWFGSPAKFIRKI